MLGTIIRKELTAILLSPKFTATFGICSLLILLSLFIGIREYRASVRQYETATQLSAQEMRERSNWMGMNSRTYRVPSPLHIIDAGITHDIGRWSDIGSLSTVKLRSSAYTEDPVFALFRFIDITFIVQILLSLFALLFTYDAFSGERESGTLKLTFAGAVPRGHYALGKFTGAWLGLVIPLCVPAALGLLMLFLFTVPFTAHEWWALALFGGASLLYFSFFIALGLLISSLTRHSNVSFLFALVAWIVLVLIIPRAGVLAAGQIVAVPSAAEIEGKHDQYAKDKWEQHKNEMEKDFQARQQAMAGMSKEERDRYQDEHLWNWMEVDDAKRTTMQKEIDEYAVRLNEDLRNRKAAQERLALAFARFSPASAYQLAVMSLSGTDLNLKARYEDAMNAYRTLFNQYVERKQKDSGGRGGIRITMDSEKGFSFDVPRERGALDLSDMPRFAPPRHAVVFPLIDFGLLALAALGAFAATFLIFLRYDVR